MTVLPYSNTKPYSKGNFALVNGAIWRYKGTTASTTGRSTIYIGEFMEADWENVGSQLARADIEAAMVEASCAGKYWKWNAGGTAVEYVAGSGGGGLADGNYGDVTVSGTGTVITINNDTVTNAKSANMATQTIKGRNTAGTGDPEDLSATTVRTILNVANGATANSSDATLLNRANHTGTQLAATISDFNTAALAAAPAETTTTTGALINGATAKTTPVDADFIGLMDSAASNILKKLSWLNIKATLKTYFDSLYPSGSGTSSGTNTGDETTATIKTKLSITTLSGSNTGDQTSVSGNAGTATALQSARQIGGVSFDGTSDIIPQTIQVANEVTDTTCFVAFFNAAVGNQQPKANTTLIYNSNTGSLGATTFVGALTGTASGNLVAGGALGTPSSGTLTNCTFPTLNQNTSGTAANLSGTPALPNGTTATTQTAADNSTKLATTAYVDTGLALKSNLASPTFTGTPTLPTGTIATTQTAGNSTTAIATTAFVTTADNLKANIASPTFTGTVTLPAGQVVNGVTLTTGGGTTTFLNANGTYSAPVAVVADGDKGDITVSGSGVIWSIDNNTVTLAKMADMATASLIYRKTAGTGAPEVNTLATLKTDLGLTGTNSGDQTTIVGITGTMAQFDTAVTDGNIVYQNQALGTPLSGTLTNCTFPTLNQNTSGSSASLSVSGQTGLITFTGTASTNRIKTVRDAADTILELGGSYTPTGTWTSMTLVTPALGTPASGNLANCTFPTLNQNTSGTAANLSGTPALQNGTAATTQTQGDNSTKIATTAYADTGLLNKNSVANAEFSQIVVSGTAYYITGSAINVSAGLQVGSTFTWRLWMSKTAAGTGTFQMRIYRGTNGSTADTADVTSTIGAVQTPVVDSMVVDVTITITATGASGSYFWTICPMNKAATATGFGIATGTTGLFSGTVSAVALNTASLKFGMSFISTTGTPTVRVVQINKSS